MADVITLIQPRNHRADDSVILFCCPVSTLVILASPFALFVSSFAIGTFFTLSRHFFSDGINASHMWHIIFFNIVLSNESIESETIQAELFPSDISCQAKKIKLAYKQG